MSNNTPNNKLVLDKPYSNIIYRVSYISSLISIYGFFQKKYDVSALVFCSFLSSINYWRNPYFGLRRNIDISTIMITMIYNVLRVATSNPKLDTFIYKSITNKANNYIKLFKDLIIN